MLKYEPRQSGVAALGNATVPEMTLWLQKAEPHIWIQFEGRQAGILKPRAITRIVAIDPPGLFKPAQ